MQKKHFLSVIILSCLMVANTGCSKDDDNPTPKTNTELITKAAWKFFKATVSGFGDVSNLIESCKRDNTVTFMVPDTGIVDEGGTKCNPTTDPQTISITWSFQNNETVLFVSTPLFTGGTSTFTIVSLTETELVVSGAVTISGITQTAEITFVH